MTRETGSCFLVYFLVAVLLSFIAGITVAIDAIPSFGIAAVALLGIMLLFAHTIDEEEKKGKRKKRLSKVN